MNRADRRKLMKNAKTSGVSKDSVLAYFAANELGVSLEDSILGNKIKDGDKVKLNVERIQSRKNYQKMTNEYRAFVESNAETIFTAKPETDTMVSFEEDHTWLFWNGDLIVEENVEVTL